MPRIRAASLDAHHDLMWAALIRAFNELAAERDESLITLREVAGRAGMARNTIYNYVKDKDELAAAAGASATRSLADQILDIVRSEGRVADVLLDICASILRALEDPPVRAALRREMTLSVPIEPGARSPLFEAFQELEKLIERGIAQGEFVDVPDTALTVELVAGVIGAAATRIERGESDLDALIADVGSAVLRMLGTVSHAGRQGKALSG